MMGYQYWEGEWGSNVRWDRWLGVGECLADAESYGIYGEGGDVSL